jgi:hypothetical protein
MSGRRLAEYRKAASQGRLEGFARERLGLWAEVGFGGVFVPGSWESCVDPDSEIVSVPAYSIDVSVDRLTASVSACGGRADGIPHLETIHNRAEPTGSCRKWLRSRAATVAL